MVSYVGLDHTLQGLWNKPARFKAVLLNFSALLPLEVHASCGLRIPSGTFSARSHNIMTKDHPPGIQRSGHAFTLVRGIICT